MLGQDASCLPCFATAGLVPFGDWIVGYAGGVLRGEGDFYDVVENVNARPFSTSCAEC